MILPSKHIRNCESLIGLSGIVVGLIEKPMSIDSLWSKFESINNTESCPTYHSFDNFILALDLLFILKTIELRDNTICKYEAN